MRAGGVDRRAFMMIAGLGGVAAALARAGPALATGDGAPEQAEFSWDHLQAKAKALAAQDYKPAGGDMQPALANLDYDQYRAINFKPEKAIWSGTSIPLRMQLFHAGYLYREPVEIHLVENGKASKIRYDRSMFYFGPAEQRVKLPEDAGFSGFRLHAPIYRRDVFSEFLVLQGASYFRGRAKGQTYGLSARGLAIDTVQPGGEEFPSFRSFWVETPSPEAETVMIYALLDSKSTTGAYRFAVSRSVDVVMDIECRLYPRRPLTHAGIAAFSSMFYFGPADHSFHDDFRPRVHDSDGLLMLTGAGDWIWRPLVTAPQILYSAFSDTGPRGFGLMQRERDYDHYQDLNAGYQKRPSAWVEPLSDWGKGSVDLIELPTNTEYADNIVAFWRPETALEPGRDYGFRYRLSWCWHVPVTRNIAEVVSTRAGLGLAEGSRYFAVDFAGGDLYAEASDEHWDYDVSATAGTIKAFTVSPNPIIDGKRIGIEYHPDGDRQADLSFQIRQLGAALTERWVYRWAR